MADATASVLASSVGGAARTALVRCASYEPAEAEAALSRALDAIGGLDWVREGMRIVVKPNLLMKKHPDAACTTHPALVAALVRLLLARKAVVVVGDSPGGPFAEFWLRAVYDGTGMTRLQKEKGFALNFDVRARTVAFPEGRALRTFDVAEFILAADAVVSFAKLKTHVFMTYTGAVKNLFGVVPGTVKAECHQRLPDPADFADLLVDLAEFVKPRLSILDAVVAMEGEGPSAGRPRFVGALVASTDPHAADLVGASLIGLPASRVPTLRAAVARGLCPASVEGLSVTGEPVASLRAIDFRLPAPAVQSKQTATGLYAAVMRRIFRSDPVVMDALCRGCGACRDACPPRAIALVGKRPRFDRKACIHCYCCQELCPHGAIRAKRSRVARLLQKVRP